MDHTVIFLFYCTMFTYLVFYCPGSLHHGVLLPAKKMNINLCWGANRPIPFPPENEKRLAKVQNGTCLWKPDSDPLFIICLFAHGPHDQLLQRDRERPTWVVHALLTHCLLLGASMWFSANCKNNTEY